jgi:hypothetical protein
MRLSCWCWHAKTANGIGVDTKSTDAGDALNPCAYAQAGVSRLTALTSAIMTTTLVFKYGALFYIDSWLDKAAPAGRRVYNLHIGSCERCLR